MSWPVVNKLSFFKLQIRGVWAECHWSLLQQPGFQSGIMLWVGSRSPGSQKAKSWWRSGRKSMKNAPSKVLTSCEHKQLVWHRGCWFSPVYCSFSKPVFFFLVLCHCSLENAGRVPGQKELSSPCQQSCVRDGPVSWKQQIPRCLVQMQT